MAMLLDERQTVLAGAPSGRRALAKLLEKTCKEPLAVQRLYLDFLGVEIATASYLRESVLRFRDAVRSQRSNFYPIVANANTEVIEELALLIHGQNDVLMTCCIDERETVTQSALIGDLDPKQKLTFDLVNAIGETDAAELMRMHGDGEKVKQTAWNNRLAALAALGLIFELAHGRTKRYRPLFGGVAHGN